MFAQIITLSPPNNVSTSDLLINKVQITWETVSGESHYQRSIELILFWTPRLLSPAGRPVLPILILASLHGLSIITESKLRPAVAGIMPVLSVDIILVVLLR